MKILLLFFLLFLLIPRCNAQENEEKIAAEIVQMHQPFQILSDSIGNLMRAITSQVAATKDPTAIRLLQTHLAELDSANENNKLRELQVDLDFAKQHPSSMMSLQLIRVKLLFYENPEFYERFNTVYENFTPEIRNSEDGKELAETLSFLKNSIVGKTAPAFSVKDINGVPLSLIDFKGKKYVLLDFWASWCMPCRSATPSVKALYKKYKDSGLEIISITKDENSKKWKKAVAEDKTDIWKHFSATENALAILKDYQVTGIPEFVLIDKNGIVAGKWKTAKEKNWKELERLLDAAFAQK